MLRPNYLQANTTRVVEEFVPGQAWVSKVDTTAARPVFSQYLSAALVAVTCGLISVSSEHALMACRPSPRSLTRSLEHATSINSVTNRYFMRHEPRRRSAHRTCADDFLRGRVLILRRASRQGGHSE
jgi:hypothetical protein